MMDLLARERAPLAEAVWKEIDEAVGQAARHVMAARRIATFEGPKGWEYAASPLGTLAQCPTREGAAVVCVPDVVVLPQIRADFSLPWSAIEVFERGGPALETGPAEAAAREVGLAEDRLAFYGDPVGRGFLTQEESPQGGLGDWSSGERVRADLLGAIEVLDRLGIPGPYHAILSLGRYYAYLRAADQGFPVARHLRGVLEAVHRSAVMSDGGALFSMRGGDFVLTVGGDLAVGYRAHDREAVHLFCVETVAAQITAPEAVCRLE